MQPPPILRDPDMPRLWQVAFADDFRAVYAFAWFPEHARWLEFSPSDDRLTHSIWDEEQFLERLAQLIGDNNPMIVRVATQSERRGRVCLASPVGQIKMLLGLRSRARTPRQLYKALLARGADIVRNAQTPAAA